MKKILVGCVLWLGLLNCCALAQSTEADMSARLIGKVRLLRGFWMGDKLQFDSAGQPLKTYEVGSFTESAFDVQKVKIHGDRLTLEGQRVALFFEEDGAAMRLPMTRSKVFGRSPEKMTIVIDGQGNRDFGKELDAIFASSLREIASSLPEFWQPFARKHFPATTQPSTDQSPQAPMGATDTAGEKPLHIGGEVKPPKVLHSVDPTYSDTARQQKFSGNVTLYLLVEPDGIPSHIAIVKPVGLGLDEKAVAAISQYRFAPATRNGEPVTVGLQIDVNFRIF